MTQHAAIQSAETMAFLRAVVAGEENLAVRSEDLLAKHFLGRKYRFLIGVGVPALLRRILELAVPGSYGFAIARTRHFDEVLLSEIRAGVEQVVLLGAGYDSRPFRFRDALGNIGVFEIDHPGTQARKRRMLDEIGAASPANLSYIAADFNQQSLPEALADHGFSPDRKTLFLWEGVSYYLPRPVVEGVLDFVSGCAAGSSIVFDYATAAFINGDTSTYGGEQVARWLKKIREPFLFGLDPQETPEFLGARKLHAVSDLGPEDLATTYLKTRDGRCMGKTFGHVRMVHARTPGATQPAASAAAIPVNEGCASTSQAEPRQDSASCEDRRADTMQAAPMLGGLIYEAVMERSSMRALNDALRQTFTGGRVVVSPGVLSLPPQANAEVLKQVRHFTAFDAENDPYHDFGRFDLAGVTYVFEVDCCARDIPGSKDPADAGKATRMLTIMRADEY
jgi:methyltransferase (TIGR00027 family)